MDNLGLDYITSLAYTAGFFDGEGCVSIVHYTTGHNDKRYYTLQMGIVNTDYGVLEYIQDIFGGTISKHSNSGNRKPAYTLRLHGENAKNMLEALYPYLRVKSKQAQLGLKFQDTMNGYAGNQYQSQLPESILECRKALKDEMGVLNKRGIW